jgi:diguanylate cyclase (GGDEF)-like protein
MIRAALMARIALSFYQSEPDEKFLTDLLSSGVFALMTLSTVGVILSFLRSGHFGPDYNFSSERTLYNVTAMIVAQSAVFSLFLAAMTERLNRDLKRLAMTDPLTNVYNRRAIEEIGLHETSRSARSGLPISVFMIDIDRFKLVNDTYGHLVGDRVLKAAADTMKVSLRAETYIARWGGDEFCALLPGAGRGDAEVAAQRVIKAFSELEIPVEAHIIRLDISIGIVSQHGGVMEFSSLVHMADMALYKAKGTGRRTFAFA